MDQLKNEKEKMSDHSKDNPGKTQDSGSVAEFKEPFERFGAWLKLAEEKEPADANAMALATTGNDGWPSVRIVLLKDWSEAGFVFYTNTESDKGQDLSENPKGALLFHWKSLRRQLRIEGKIEKVSDEEADAYFSSRPRASRIGAWASKQSSVMQGRFEFETRIAKYTAKFGLGKIPRPDFWTGFRMIPFKFEFWQDREFRLHDRTVFKRNDAGQHCWQRVTLYP